MADIPAPRIVTSVEEFGGTAPRAEIEHAVVDSLSDFADARVSNYVPLLVHPAARGRLHAACGLGEGAQTD